ncbi:MAG: hypothetical protein LC768_16415 [Acidobacteria bacterium]|nr:hypothetical protein [Acidobacteriota bacterium]MCA1639883.1 hypothetical protein [Acidobacteriota bacterium]
MKKKFYSLSILAALVVFGAAMASNYSVSAGAGNSGSSASGHGNYTENDGELRTFSFHARTKDGVTKGSFVVNNRSNGHFLKGNIDCLNIVGNTATMSGTITSSSVEDLVPVGTKTRFGVVDNGEGTEALPDRMSRFSNFSQTTCDVSPITFHSLIVEGGNIQVKP